VAREFGTLIITDPDAPTVERSTITCCHCQHVVIIAPGAAAADVGGFCRLCFKHTCGPCADKPCTPFEAKLERMEGRRVFLRGVEYLGSG
jgi:hypothetical protein